MSARLGRAVFERTVGRTYVAARAGVNWALERHHGITTTGRVELEELGVAGDHRVYYKPTEWSLLRRVLPVHEVGADDVFVDFGSGMGRIVFQVALRYDCKRVVGVELAEQLNQVAQANIDRNRHRLRCPAVELVAGDVLDYPVPDDVTIAFFANPFTGPIFATVVERLLASVDQHPRRLRIIYRNPVEHDLLVSTGKIRPVRHLPGRRPGTAWSRSNSTTVYEIAAG